MEGRTNTIRIESNRPTFGTSGSGASFRRDVIEPKDVLRSTYVSEVRTRFNVMRGQAKEIIAIAAKSGVDFDTAYARWRSQR